MAITKKVSKKEDTDFEAELRSTSKVEEKKQVNFTNSALSLVKTSNGYLLLKVEIDPESKVAGNVEVIGEFKNKTEAQNRFKRFVVDLGFFN